MLRAISIFLQTLFLLVVNVLALFIPHAHHIQMIYSHSGAQMHVFVWDGILAMLAAYLLILLLEAACRRIVQWSGMTSLALLLALIVGFLPWFRLGFKTL